MRQEVIWTIAGILLVCLVAGVSALPTKEELMNSYRQPSGKYCASSYSICKSDVLKQYFTSSQPIYTIPQSAQSPQPSGKYYTVMILDNCVSIDTVEDALELINPFFHYEIVSPDPTKYKVIDGVTYSYSPYSVVITPGTRWSGKMMGAGAVTIWIPQGFVPTPQQLAGLIGHECSHDIQTTSNPDDGVSVDRIVNEYLTESMSWGPTVITVIKG